MLHTEIILLVSCNHCGMRFWRYMVDEDLSVKTFSYNFILSVLPFLPRRSRKICLIFEFPVVVQAKYIIFE